jgi:SseB protein N-terminal domain
MSIPLSNQGIEDSIVKASEGDINALRTFFEAFLAGPIFVLNRTQKIPLKNQADYTNSLCEILAVKEKDRAIVPVFSSIEHLESWTEQKLEYRSLSGIQLIESIPNEWWVCINPGQGIEKELSPWELQSLRFGKESIEEIIAENINSLEPETLDLVELPQEEYQTTISTLIQHAKNNSGIKKIFLAFNNLSNSTNSSLPDLIILAVLEKNTNSDLLACKNEIESALAPTLIGRATYKIFIENITSPFISGAFQNITPIWQENQ